MEVTEPTHAGHARVAAVEPPGLNSPAAEGHAPALAAPRRAERVLLLGALPPPLHGQGLANTLIMGWLRAYGEVVPVNQSPGGFRPGPVGMALKAAKAGAGALAVARARPGRDAVLVSVATGAGVTLQIPAAALAAARGLPLVLHHHGYAYVDERSPAMARMLRLTRGRATHVAPCAHLCEGLERRYGERLRHVEFGNVHYATPPAAVPPPLPGPELTIGLLSNLTAEKGLHLFLELLEAARGRGLPVRGRLAGPIPDPADRRGFDAAAARLGDALRWDGPVDGPTKSAFYAGIDLFLLPTLYKVESQPIVLFEALSHGRPAIAFGRGCLARMGGDAPLEIVPTDADFVAAALPAVERLSRDRAALGPLREAARALYDRYVEATRPHLAGLAAALGLGAR